MKNVLELEEFDAIYHYAKLINNEKYGVGSFKY